MCAEEDQNRVIEALDNGASDYLFKPIIKRDLIGTLKATLGEHIYDN